MSDATPAVRVVVVGWHAGADLDSFRSTLAGSTTAAYQLVVVDNTPDAGDPAADRAAAAGAVLVRPGRNLGYGQAANAGAAIPGVHPPWLVVANPDLLWAPGSLDRLLAAGARWPRAGALGPQILGVDGSTYPSGRELPSVSTGVGHALLRGVWPHNPWSQAYLGSGSTDERAVGWLSGACLLLRREAFHGVGGFDRAFYMYFEDTDLGSRLGQQGWQNVIVPSASVTHAGGHATRRVRAEMLAEHHRSAQIYLSRRYNGRVHAPLRLVLRLGLNLRSRLLTGS